MPRRRARRGPVKATIADGEEIIIYTEETIIYVKEMIADNEEAIIYTEENISYTKEMIAYTQENDAAEKKTMRARNRELQEGKRR